jgi:hypothetical protein
MSALVHLAKYDTKHKAKQAKNKRFYRNPYAALHYAEALDKARALIETGTLSETVAALEKCFTPDFWPLKQFKKLNGV